MSRVAAMESTLGEADRIKNQLAAGIELEAIENNFSNWIFTRHIQLQPGQSQGGQSSSKRAVLAIYKIERKALEERQLSFTHRRLEQEAL